MKEFSFLLFTEFFYIFSFHNYKVFNFSCFVISTVFYKERVPYTHLSKTEFPIIASKFCMNMNNYTSSYHVLYPLNATNAIYSFVSPIIREYYRFLHCQNILCSPNKTFLTLTNKIINIYQVRFKMKQNLRIENTYEHIIYLYSSWGNVFGHFFIDALSALQKIPTEIINKSMIMVSFYNHNAIEYLKLFDIQEDRILNDINYWYFAKNLYIIYPIEEIFGFIGSEFPNVVNILRNKLNVSLIKGSRYIFINRPKGTKRCISNFQEFFNYIQITIPSINWEIDENFTYKDISEGAKRYATFKLLVTPTGSNTLNCLFMNTNYTTGVCFIYSRDYDFALAFTMIVFKIWANGFCNSFYHNVIGINNCNIFYGLTCIKRLLYALNNSVWPSETFNDMHEAFNLTEINNVMKKNLNVSRRIIINKYKIEYPKSFIIAYGFP